MKPLLWASALLFGVLGRVEGQTRDVAISRQIDTELWSVVAASVVNADIVAMGATYHPDAVVVTPTSTQPVASQLAAWGKGMVDAKAQHQHATVEFRFSRRVDNPETAFEVGMFKYSVIDSHGAATVQYIPMEALLVRYNGKWHTMMEHQLPAATVAEWDGLAP